MTKSSKWKKFEQLVYDIQKELAGDAVVTLDDHIVGEDSKQKRQIDISIRRNIGQYNILVVVECKDYKKPVDAPKVESFVTKMRDVRANKGAIVSSSGFSKAAKEVAKTYQIDLFRLVDTSSIDWAVYVTAPVLLERTFIQSFNFAFKDFDVISAGIIKSDLLNAVLFNKDNKSMGTLRELIQKKWDEQTIPHEQGSHDVVLGENVIIEANTERAKVTIKANIKVGRKYYYGNLPLKIRGLKNEQSGGLITKHIITERIEPYKIEMGQVDGWEEISDPEQLAGNILIKLAYSDLYKK